MTGNSKLGERCLDRMKGREPGLAVRIKKDTDSISRSLDE